MCEIWQTCLSYANAHLVVMWAEVLKKAKASVADADKNSDAENNKVEKRCGSPETWTQSK